MKPGQYPRANIATAMPDSAAPSHQEQRRRRPALPSSPSLSRAPRFMMGASGLDVGKGNSWVSAQSVTAVAPVDASCIVLRDASTALAGLSRHGRLLQAPAQELWHSRLLTAVVAPLLKILPQNAGTAVARPQGAGQLSCANLTREEHLDAWLRDAATAAPADVRERIARGKAFLKCVSTGTARADATPEDLANIIWALAARSAADGAAFADGAFILHEDCPIGAIAAQDHSASPIARLMQEVRAVDGLYRRVSSHLRQFRQAEVWGIDIDASRDGTLLPGGGRHLLLHLINDERLGSFIFLKPETYGTNNAVDFIKHGYRFMHALRRRALGGNQKEGMRKEHVPKGLIVEFARVVAGNERAPDGG